METVVIDLAGQAASLVWLASPVGLVSLVAIVGFVLSGIPGRIILGMEAKLVRRKGTAELKLSLVAITTT